MCRCFRLLTTQRTIRITRPRHLDQLVCNENFGLDQKPSKEFVFPIGMCFPDVASLEAAKWSIKLNQVSWLGRVRAISSSAPKELIFLFTQRNLLQQVPKQHKLCHFPLPCSCATAPESSIDLAILLLLSCSSSRPTYRAPAQCPSAPYHQSKKISRKTLCDHRQWWLCACSEKLTINWITRHLCTKPRPISICPFQP